MADTQIALYHGDCLDVLPALPADGVDMVFADLPYKVKKYHSTDCAWDATIPWQLLWQQLHRAAKEKTVFAMTAAQPFTTDLINSQRQYFRYCLVWHKPGGGNTVRAKYAPIRCHEDVAIFSRPNATYNPIMTERDKPVTKLRNYGLHRSFSGGVWDVQKECKRTYTHKFPNSIIIATNRSSKDRGLHPTQKPVALLEWLIKTYTHAGDTVLDPVSGSATTAIAAMRNGRNVICIEKDRTYFEAGVKRVREEVAASNVDAEVVVHG